MSKRTLLRKLPFFIAVIVVAVGLSACGSSTPQQYGAYGAAGVGPGYQGTSAYGNNQYGTSTYGTQAGGYYGNQYGD